MPTLDWTEAERKSFWRLARASLWTGIVVLAILLFLGLVTFPPFLNLLVVIIYAVAIWVVVFKMIRVRWPG